MYALNESLAFLLNRAGAAVGRAFSDELKECDMTLPMWRVVAALWSRGDQSLSGLSEVTSVEISTLSRQVAVLHKRKLVSRTRSGVNWRSINISLTASGRRIVEKLLPAVERHEHAAVHGIGSADIRRLKQLLNKIYDNITSLDKALPLGLSDDATSIGPPTS